MNTLPIDRLREMLAYNVETGAFVWRKKAGRNMAVSIEAGTVDRLGYRYITLDNVRVLAHRAAWAMVYGEWPAGIIDHRDGNPRNNSIGNLRHSDKSLNALNLHHKPRAASGHRGVYLNKRTNRYFASFRGGHLGSFSDPAEAAAAYQQAKTSFLSTT